MTETTLNVEGVSCAYCKAAVEGLVNKLSGVEVRYDDAKVTADGLRGAIEEAGYSVAA